MSSTDFMKGSLPADHGAIWIVTADSGRVRIFSTARADGELVEVEDLLNPNMRLRESDATSTPKGRSTQGPSGSGQTFEPRHTQSEHSAELFAKAVCEKMEAARQRGTIQRIYLISEPSFLGLIRKHLNPATKPLIVQELPRDLSRQPVAEIRRVLPERL